MLPSVEWDILPADHPPHSTVAAGQERGVASRLRMPSPTWVSNQWLAVAGALLFSMLFVPTTYRPVKIVLLALALAGAMAPILATGRVFLHRSIAGWTLLMVLTGMFGVVIGLLNDTPGALRVSTVYVFWPILYTVLATGIRTRSTVDGLMKLLVLATIAIGLYALSFVLHSAGWLPDWLYVEIDQGQLIGFYAGYIEFSLYSVSSLLFLVPFSLAALLTWRHLEHPPVSRRWLWLSLVLGLTTAFLTGRRALWLVIAVSPFVTFAFYLFLPRRHLRLRARNIVLTATTIGLVGTALLFSMSYAYGFSLSSALHYVREGFDFEGDVSAIARQEQFRALLQGWSASPIWGAGHGASAEAFGSLRSGEQPWSYELYYVALLYQTGLLGFAIYSAGVMWIYWMGLKLVRSGHPLGHSMLPLLSGMTCFLIATATNPYLGKFDCLWVIFVPVAIINYWLLNRQAEQA